MQCTDEWTPNWALPPLKIKRNRIKKEKCCFVSVTAFPPPHIAREHFTAQGNIFSKRDSQNEEIGSGFAYLSVNCLPIKICLKGNWSLLRQFLVVTLSLSNTFSCLKVWEFLLTLRSKVGSNPLDFVNDWNWSQTFWLGFIGSNEWQSTIISITFYIIYF